MWMCRVPSLLKNKHAAHQTGVNVWLVLQLVVVMGIGCHVGFSLDTALPGRKLKPFCLGFAKQVTTYNELSF